MVGSSLNDVLQVSTVPSKSELKKKEEEETKEAKESSESQKTKQHKRVLEKGKPDDAMPGHKGRQVNRMMSTQAFCLAIFQQPPPTQSCRIIEFLAKFLEFFVQILEFFGKNP